jgi:hypothetical protein
MKVHVTKGPKAGQTLEMCTRQAQLAIAGEWAIAVAVDTVDGKPRYRIGDVVAEISATSEIPAPPRRKYRGRRAAPEPERQRDTSRDVTGVGAGTE